MAKEDFFFRLYYVRLLASTTGWKDDEFGAYLKLLIHQFDKGSIPSDLKDIVRIAPSAKKNWDLLKTKFVPDGKGGLINEFMNGVRLDYEALKEKNAENGRRGGRRRKIENPEESQNEANGLPNETQNEANGLPDETQTITQNKASQKSEVISHNSEREEYSPANVFYKIERCMEIAFGDGRWVKASRVTVEELKAFNKFLEGQGVYEKNPADYKQHFANWKRKGGLEVVEPEKGNDLAPRVLSPRELADKKLLESL